MRSWTLESANSGATLMAEAVSKVVAAIGDNDFSQHVLTQVNRLMPVGCWSVYRVGGDQPRLFLSGTHHRKDTTTGSWQAYLSGPHLVDRTFAFDGADSTRTLITHLTAEEIPTRVHREKVYRQFDMSERLSVVRPQTHDSVFALNFYRYNGQQFFTDYELAAFESIAPLLLSAVQRHISLQPEPCDPSQILTLTSIRQAFELHRPDLTTRELDVVSRAVLGMSYEGIATDLGLKLPTVKTYRNRAFDRMQISFRSELVRYYLSIASTPHSVSMR